MVSDFLIVHLDNPFFLLSQDKWKAAVKGYPELLDDHGVQYIEQSAVGSIQVGFGGYFDNDTIMNQFTRLFKMLLFKQAYANHKFHIIVDNARAHSAKHYSVEYFGMKPSIRCKIDKIFHRDENGNKKSTDCFCTTGSNQRQSKGLLILATELGIKISSNIRLEELKKLLNSHDAFKNVRFLLMISIL